jgi:hypothetical protein
MSVGETFARSIAPKLNVRNLGKQPQVRDDRCFPAELDSEKVQEHSATVNVGKER